MERNKTRWRYVKNKMKEETKDELKETTTRGRKRRNKKGVMKENHITNEAAHKRTTER